MIRKLMLGTLLAALALVGCTGTEEPPLELLIAVGTEDAVVFYPAGTDEAEAVGRWELAAPVVDLARPEGETRLWVLSPDALAAYPLQGSRSDRGPDPVEPSVRLEPGTDCSGGTLVEGAFHLLVQCGTGVWTVALDNPVLEAVDTEDAPEGTRYLLGPDDRVVRVEPTPGGFRLVYPIGDETLTFEAGNLVEVRGLAAAWADEQLAVAVGDGVEDAAFYLWDAASTDPPRASDPLRGVLEPRWIRSLPNGWAVGGAAAYLLRIKDRSDAARSGAYLDAAVSPDGYLYLLDAGRLVVVDLLDTRLAEHERTADGTARALVLFPTNE